MTAIYPHQGAEQTVIWNEVPNQNAPTAIYPSRQYASAPLSRDCPNQSDFSYAGVGSISDTDIRRLFEFWLKVSKSEKTFDETFERLLVGPNGDALKIFRRTFLKYDPDLTSYSAGPTSYSTSRADFSTVFTFGDAMYAVDLRRVGNRLIPTAVTDGVTWAGRPF
ncbi:MAG TPA: hypothetical protein VHW02_04375 [Rhizomicrobium sp.]|jgi:hypothetical protein|nr:hypothetical protein [Rhizomicrobium sp.]